MQDDGQPGVKDVDDGVGVVDVGHGHVHRLDDVLLQTPGINSVFTICKSYLVIL